MPQQIDPTVARLQVDVPAAESSLDEALIAVSTLMGSVVRARRDTPDVPAVRGHATIQRLARAQVALVAVSGDILRVHGDLTEIGGETAGLDLHECPAIAAAGPPKLHAVS